MSLNYNFDTKEFEEIEDLATLPDKQVIQFLPITPGRDGGAARGLYRCLRSMGKSKLEAYIEVLCLTTGTKLPDPKEKRDE